MTEDVRLQTLMRLEAGSNRTAAAEREHWHYSEFRRTHDLNDTADAVALYLTWLLDTTQPSGNRLRYRLRLLDIAAVTAGRPRPSADRHLRTYLRGLHQEAALGTGHTRPPLYIEDVRAAIDALVADHLQQARDIALLLLANNSGLPAETLRHLDWSQIKLRQQHMTITVPVTHRGRGPSGRLHVAAQPDRPCAVNALRELRRQVGPVPGLVFSRRDGKPPSMSTMHDLLNSLDGRGGPWSGDLQPTPTDKLLPVLDRLARLRPRQLRDRALLTLGFAACLTTTEAMTLHVDDIETASQGLILNLPLRPKPTAVPTARDPRYCPVGAWRAWHERLQEQAATGPTRHAFPPIRKAKIIPGVLDATSLSRVVAARCAAAGLHGEFAFTSLRIGFLRTGARADVPLQLLLNQAGLRWLGSVELHVHRERLISHSVAGRLGL